MDSTENEIQKYHITDRIIISMDKKINLKKATTHQHPSCQRRKQLIYCV